MISEFEILRTDEPDGPLVAVGPDIANSDRQIRLPSTVVREVRYGPGQPKIRLKIEFTGDKYEIRELSVQGQDAFISSQFLASLALPKVLRAIALDAIPNSKYWAIADDMDGLGIETDEFLAQLYWFEHLSWGSPRAAIMKYMGWSRPNANWHIRKIASKFRLPGAHSKGEQNSSDQRK